MTGDDTLADLCLVDDIELSGEHWHYNLFGVFLIDGKWYTSTDAGCSCPTPWEDHTTIADFAGPFTVTGVIRQIRALECGDEIDHGTFIDDKHRMVTTVQRADSDRRRPNKEAAQ